MGFRGFAGHFYGACEIQSDNISTWYCKDKIVTLIYDIECMLFHAIWLVYSMAHLDFLSGKCT